MFLSSCGQVSPFVGVLHEACIIMYFVLGVWGIRFFINHWLHPVSLASFPGRRGVGEVAWVFLYGGLGLLFADSWEVLSQLATDLSGLLVGVLLLGVGAYAMVRRR